MKRLIGREKEIESLEAYVDSGQAEFIAIYGRRRVGKTFLINQLFRNRLAFSLTGIIDGTPSEQMESFVQALEFNGILHHGQKTVYPGFLPNFQKQKANLNNKVHHLSTYTLEE